MYALIDYREYIARRQQKLTGRSQPRRMSFEMFRALHSAADGRTGYVVMGAQGIIKDVSEYHLTAATHRAEVFAWQGNRVLLRHRDTLAWWTFTGDEMVIVEYDDDAQAGQVAA